MKHFNETHGMTKTPTWISWSSMRSRCLNPNDPQYKNYGGSGIKICKRWNNFSNFLKDMGIRPKGKTLGRIVSCLDYKPSNCEWQTLTEQNRNKSDNRRIYYKGATQCLSAWVESSGIKRSTLKYRLKIGLRGDDLFRAPNRKRF